jgi:hypothetical protein
MTTKKINSKKNGKANKALTAVGGAHALPTSPTPKAPNSSGPVTTAKVGGGNRPYPTMISHAVQAAEEVRGAPKYLHYFGELAPTAEVVANGLEFAAAWSSELKAAKAGLGYVQAQESLAWTYTLGVLNALHDPFAYAKKRDPSIARDFGSLDAVLTARSDTAKRARANAKKRASSKSPPADPPPTDPKQEPQKEAAPEETPAKQ